MDGVETFELAGYNLSGLQLLIMQFEWLFLMSEKISNRGRLFLSLFCELLYSCSMLSKIQILLKIVVDSMLFNYIYLYVQLFRLWVV